MPDPHLLRPLISNLPVFAALLLVLALLKIVASPRFKGWQGERRVARALARQLDPALYRSFHDLYLPRTDGKDTTQLDHIVVSPFGIFVIETKNFRGWIFGSEKQAQWTQSINRKTKIRFQNPLRQNLLHVRALAGFLGLAPDFIRPVVFFVGDGELKTAMPDNVLNRGLIPWIKRHTAVTVDEATRLHVIQRLEDLERTTDRKAAARTHVTAVKSRRAV